MSASHAIKTIPKITIKKGPLAQEQQLDTLHDTLPEINFSAELPTPLLHKLNELLRELSKPKYSKPLSYDQIVQIFQEFYHDFKQLAEITVKGTAGYNKVELKDFNQDEPISDNDLKVKTYVEIAELRVTSALYSRLLVKSEDNVRVNKYINTKISIIRKAKDLDYKKLIDVHDVDLNLPILHQISTDFDHFQNLQSPLQKITVLINIHSQLNTFLKEHLDTANVNGDYILPLLIYLILINDFTPIHDFYLNFAYIRSFRNQELLTGDVLYCLTNLEAALTFIQSLDLTSFQSFKTPLTKDEETIRQQTEPLITPSSNFFFNTFDSSVKMLSKFKPETTVDVDFNNNPIKNFMGDVMKWTRSSTPVTAATAASREIISRSRSGSLNSKTVKSSASNDNIHGGLSLPSNIDLDRFNDKKFEDLSIKELHGLFNDYLVLTKHLKSSTSNSAL